MLQRVLWCIWLWRVTSSAEQPQTENATAFVNKTSARLKLLSSAAQQILMAPAVDQEPRFHSTLQKVSKQLQESAGILEQWGADYAKNAEAGEMALQLAEQGAQYEVRDLKAKLRAAIEADQEEQLDEPRRFAELTARVSKLRSQVSRLRGRGAQQKRSHPKPQGVGASFLSEAWPKPPSNATQAQVGLFMRGVSQRVSAADQNQENEQNLDKLESHLASLEGQLEDAREQVAAKHAESEAAHQLVHEEKQAAASVVRPHEDEEPPLDE